MIWSVMLGQGLEKLLRVCEAETSSDIECLPGAVAKRSKNSVFFNECQKITIVTLM